VKKRFTAARLLRNYNFSRLRYLPLVALRIRNFGTYILDYGSLIAPGRRYVLRSGISIKTGQRIDTATIGTVFLSRDYGQIPDNIVIFDIGANIGAFSLYAIASSSSSTVYAYEPMPSNFSLLQENIRDNGFEEKIIAIPYGLSAKTERRRLYVSDLDVDHSLYAKEHGGQWMDIPCVSLQEALHTHGISRCDLLKLDCEGAEYECLYSASEYLDAFHEIRLEYHDEKVRSMGPEYNIESLIQYLIDKGFVVKLHKPETADHGMLWVERSDIS